MLKTRVKTACMFVPVCALIVLFSGAPYVLNIAVTLLSLGAVWEICSVTGALKERVYGVLPLILALVMLPFNLSVPPIYGMSLAALMGGTIAFVMRKTHNKLSSIDLPYFGLWIASYSAFLFRSLITLRRMENGLYNLVLMIACCVATEVAGYFIGRRWGRHKLAPHISPHKTFEGSVGGVIAACALLMLGTAIYAAAADVHARYGLLLLYGVSGSMAAQLGDLAMSAVKRIAGVKDFSNFLPGHGGLLDRFDGQLFAAPFTAAFLTFIGEIIA